MKASVLCFQEYEKREDRPCAHTRLFSAGYSKRYMDTGSVLPSGSRARFFMLSSALMRVEA